MTFENNLWFLLCETRPMGGSPCGMAFGPPHPHSNIPALSFHRTDVEVQSIDTQCQLHFCGLRHPVAAVLRLWSVSIKWRHLAKAGMWIGATRKDSCITTSLGCYSYTMQLSLLSKCLVLEKNRDNCWSWIEPISEVSKAFSNSTLKVTWVFGSKECLHLEVWFGCLLKDVCASQGVKKAYARWENGDAPCQELYSSTLIDKSDN